MGGQHGTNVQRRLPHGFPAPPPLRIPLMEFNIDTILNFKIGEGWYLGPAGGVVEIERKMTAFSVLKAPVRSTVRL